MTNRIVQIGGSNSLFSAVEDTAAGNATAGFPVILKVTDELVLQALQSGIVVNPPENIVSVLNSTDVNLAAGATFEGAFELVKDFAGIRVTVQSSHASASRGLEFWCSKDGLNGFVEDSYSIPANIHKTYAAVVSAPYFKIRYTNGGAQTTSLQICVIYQRNVSIPSSHRIGDTVMDDDDAQLVQNVNKAQRPDGTYRNIDSSINGNLFTMIGDVQSDAGGRVRVSQFTTLGDYKALNYDHTLLMENAGTGTGSWSGNKYNMSVTAGQWFAKSSRRPHQYYSGKSQGVETTFDNFHPQSNVTKRVGYFSSSIASPFSATLDGFWLESDGTTIRLISSRAGTETLNVPITSWSGYDFLNSYKDPAHWQNFTVVLFDFLWLGGAILRLWVKTQWGFVLAHQFDYSGTAQDVFILSPNQPIRYEIRSTTGSGSFRYICAQVSTEGSTVESGISRSVHTGSTAISLATVGTKYPVKAVRRLYRDVVVRIDDLAAFVNTNDQVLWTLEMNPTLSAPLTYSAVSNSGIEEASGNGTITVTAAGTVVASGYLTQNGTLPSNVLRDNFLAYLGGSLAGVQDEAVLCVTPITSNVSMFGGISIKEY